MSAMTGIRFRPSRDFDLAQALGRLVAVELGHLAVHQDEIDRIARQHIERFEAVGCHQGDGAELVEDVVRQLAIDGVVLRNQYPYAGEPTCVVVGNGQGPPQTPSGELSRRPP